MGGGRRLSTTLVILQHEILTQNQQSTAAILVKRDLLLSSAKCALKYRNISKGCTQGPGLGIILVCTFTDSQAEKKRNLTVSLGGAPEDRLR